MLDLDFTLHFRWFYSCLLGITTGFLLAITFMRVLTHQLGDLSSCSLYRVDNRTDKVYLEPVNPLLVPVP